MSSVRSALSARSVVTGAVFAALACAVVLGFEARRGVATETWFELSAGLGIGSQAGVANGWFAYDARLESRSDGAFDPLPGSAIGAKHGDGVFTLAPFSH